VLLYDLTITYVEGTAGRRIHDGPRGYSAIIGRTANRWWIALIVTARDFHSAMRRSDGNRADVSTLETILRMVERKYGKARRIWVFDRGNRERGESGGDPQAWWAVFGGTPRRQMSMLNPNYSRVTGPRLRPDVEVKRVAIPQGNETYILLSHEPAAKRKRGPIRKRFSTRMGGGFEASATTIAEGPVEGPQQKWSAGLGKIQARHAQGKRSVRSHSA